MIDMKFQYVTGGFNRLEMVPPLHDRTVPVYFSHGGGGQKTWPRASTEVSISYDARHHLSRPD